MVQRHQQRGTENEGVVRHGTMAWHINIAAAPEVKAGREGYKVEAVGPQVCSTTA